MAASGSGIHYENDPDLADVFKSMVAAKLPITVLNIAKKYSVAERLTYILSNGKSSRSSVNSVSYWEFNYFIQNQRCRMIFTAVDGHITNLDFKMPFQDDWSRCKPIELFEKNIEKIEVKGKLNIINNLKQEAEQCQCLIRWLDCDREGESIAGDVSEVCLKVNPDLHVYRALFSLLSDREIKMAAKNLKKFNTSLSDVASMRREMDLCAGASFTKFQTLEVGNKFIFPSVDKDDHVLIYGSCLFPALGFVVERSKETRESWMVGCKYNVGNHMISFEVPPTMLKFDATYEDAFPVYTSCVTVSGTAKAVTLERTETNDRPRP
ncbi:putative DNA topoisomerase [Helianthus annuus]|nr:putative DNA topoisomerase [Helianthus annuus]